MQKRKVDVSVILTHYKAQKEIIKCIESINKYKTSLNVEIIVVDNDLDFPVEKSLKKRFPSVRYIKSPYNLGFDAGNNLGAKSAQGIYLFFLNADTLFKSNVIKELVEFEKNNLKTGIISPILLDQKNTPFTLQGAKNLDPLNGIFVLSFLNKVFPKNPISRDYWQADWDKKKLREIDVVPGTAMFMTRKVFDEIGRFDENFFIYFEEHDICKRALQKGYKNYIFPEARLYHEWGVSTTDKKVFNKHFADSRFYYFKKHYGILAAMFVSWFAQIGKYEILLLPVLGLGLFLLLFRLPELMMFIGDFGWFYLSARDMLTRGDIPLVGIASSHPWLHQGPLWTYLLAIGFAVSSFHPLSGGIIAILFGLGSIILTYMTAKLLMDGKGAIITALLFATAPLVIIHARMPYHTAPIPFFTLLLLYSLIRWVNGSAKYFVVALFSLAILYNLELASVVYGFAVLALLVFGFVRKKSWVSILMNRQIFLASFLAIFIPMLPVLIYDVGNGFPQTLKFAAWMGYKVLTMFGYPPLTEDAPTSFGAVFLFFTDHLQKLFFLPNWGISLLIFFASIFYVFGTTLIALKEKKFSEHTWLFSFFLLTGLLGFFAAKTMSEAYLPMLFPALIIALGMLATRMMNFRSNPKKVFAVYVISSLVLLNISSLLHGNYLMKWYSGGYGPTFAERNSASEFMVKAADKNRYTIKGNGVGSEFASFTMNYEYLTWYKGHAPEKDASLVFTITDTTQQVIVSKSKE